MSFIALQMKAFGLKKIQIPCMGSKFRDAAGFSDPGGLAVMWWA